MVYQNAHLGPECSSELRCAQGFCILLLNFRVWATVKGRVSFEYVGTIIWFGSRDPILEGFWSRALGIRVNVRAKLITGPTCRP